MVGYVCRIPPKISFVVFIHRLKYRTEDFKLEIISSAELSSSSSLVTVLSSSYVLCTDPDNSQESISLKCIPFVPYRTRRNSKRLDHSPSKPKTAWSPNGKMLELTSNRITSLLPLSSELIAFGDSKSRHIL